MTLLTETVSKMGRRSPLSFNARNIRHLCRAASLMAYGIVGPLHSQATELMLKAYNEACQNEAPLYPIPDRNHLLSFLVVLVVLLPVACSRSNFAVGTNMSLSIVTLLWAIHLRVTARTPPYECFTQAGTYEDHVSGLPEFEVCFLLFILISYVLFFIDCCIWMARRLAPFFKPRWN
jgi:hypothetical protein